jgi:hypothetical protein
MAGFEHWSAIRLTEEIPQRPEPLKIRAAKQSGLNSVTDGSDGPSLLPNG